jgi:hypothetical protein
MHKLAKKLKEIIKGVAPKSTFGTDPNDPWSTRAGINEASLDTYLLSRGIDPKRVSKDTKISHAKSSAFIKWKQQHTFEEVENINESELEQYLLYKGMNPKYVSLSQKISYAKSADFIRWKQTHMHEGISSQHTSVQLRKHSLDKSKHMNKVVTTNGLHKEDTVLDEVKTIQGTALDKFRQASAERAKKHNEIEKQMKARHAAGQTDVKGAIDRLEKHLNKEEAEHKVGDSVVVHSKFFGKQKGKVTKVDNQSIHVQRDGKGHSEKYPHDAVVKEDTYQDPQAATQTVADAANGADDVQQPSNIRKSELTKSARMIKSLYKKHNAVKEEVYDHEKEDKSVASYGKKPKFIKTDDSNEVAKEPEAAAIMSGGKTLTGEPRDTIEIDPLMKNRPNNQPNEIDKVVKDKKKK